MSKPHYSIDEVRRIDAVALAIQYHERVAKTPLFARPDQDGDQDAVSLAQLLADADTIRRYAETGELPADSSPPAPAWIPAPTLVPASPSVDWWRIPPWELTKIWCTTSTTADGTAPLGSTFDGTAQ